MVSEAQKRATKKWDSANKDKKRYSMYKSGAKNFYKIATDEDLKDIFKIYQEEMQKRKLK